MIVAFSTSSPQASVAILSQKGEVLAFAREMAPQAASAACIRLLKACLLELNLELGIAEGFLSDLGPGSFTGVRVGVTLAKMLGWAHQKKVAGLDAFDLISLEKTVVFPNKKSEFWLREPGKDPILTSESPSPSCLGYGHEDLGEFVYPEARCFDASFSKLNWKLPEELLPAYLVGPSISIPKKPFVKGEIRG